MAYELEDIIARYNSAVAGVIVGPGEPMSDRAWAAWARHLRDDVEIMPEERIKPDVRGWYVRTRSSRATW